ncbi:dynein axonemal heavy chain 1-like [Periplaneta americana]|uniref:dynein axonemal heavy chain 1-like n=1 Tax=Periplaneta americana TaxID=6978 RepID=UPI0037E73AA6
MKDRHWNQIQEETGIKIEYSPTLTFAMCLEKGLADVQDEVIKIAEGAGKEYAIEETLGKMQADWENIILEVTPYKNTGTYIMKISDDVSQMLDDHAALTQTISFSPFRAALEKEISEWETQLHLTTDVLDAWAECQKQWMYLEPIFTSEDINRQLPVESKKYKTMERNWRRIMKNAFDNPKVGMFSFNHETEWIVVQVMDVCPDRTLLESLKECNTYLEQIQKGLADYLETKRSVFPRFYFLSDDELLEILSQAKNPLAVQPHLRKCFENIQKVLDMGFPCDPTDIKPIVQFVPHTAKLCIHIDCNDGVDDAGM